MFTASELRPVKRWMDKEGQYSLWLLERPAFTFPPVKAPTPTSIAHGVPTLSDFQTMWKAWDTITLDMIPESMLFTKLIGFHHICLLHLGHNPTFLDIHLSKLLGEDRTEPKMFEDIFKVRM